jgi:hypothetical protein
MASAGESRLVITASLAEAAVPGRMPRSWAKRCATL